MACGADIVVEVVTPSPRDERRDRVEKMAEYAAFGVAQYWLIDPALGTFEIFQRGPAGYTQVVAVTAGRIENVPGCAGLRIESTRSGDSSRASGRENDAEAAKAARFACPQKSGLAVA